MARSNFRDVRKIEEELEDVRALRAERDRLRLTDPDSPRIQALEGEASSKLDSIERSVGQISERTRETAEGVEKFERLSFDVQRQVATLSATLILALLALSEVFEDAEGLRAAVGEASGNLIWAVGASVMAMSFSTVSGVKNFDHLRKTADAARRERAAYHVTRLLLGTSFLLSVLASGASFWFFFNGLLTLSRFLSVG